jgi:hypothetical protein
LVSNYLDLNSINYSLHDLFFGVKETLDVGIDHRSNQKVSDTPIGNSNPDNEEDQVDDNENEGDSANEDGDDEDGDDEDGDDNYEDEMDPGYDSDNGLLYRDGPSPGNTPTNSQEVREKKDLILEYKSTIDQAEYDLKHGRRAMHALHKNPEDLDTDDEIALEEAYDEDLSKPENMEGIAQTILSQNQIKENAERDLNIARAKLAKHYEQSGTTPSPEPSLASPGPARPRELSEESRAPSNTFDDIYDATPLGSPRVPSNQDSSNVPIAESSEPVSLNPNTSESNHPELERETEVESTRKRKRDSVSDTEEGSSKR